jgi:hypothetical protein
VTQERNDSAHAKSQSNQCSHAYLKAFIPRTLASANAKNGRNSTLTDTIFSRGSEK